MLLHRDPETPNVPLISLVDVRKGKTFIFERCFLWLRRPGVGAHIIPDGFTWGSYVIGDDLRLKHLKRSPVPSWKAAEAGIVRACNRFLELSIEQVDKGLEIELPIKMEERAA